MTARQRTNARYRARYKQRMDTEPTFAATERARRAAWEANKRKTDPAYRQRQRDSSKRWAVENPEKAKQSQRNKYLRRTIVTRYGITREQYEEMWRKQSGRCAICQTVECGVLGKHSSPAIDHDHSTGLVRGLLCHACNIGLGAFKDRVSTLKAAIDYLERASISP